jgi:hypothetical protein
MNRPFIKSLSQLAIAARMLAVAELPILAQEGQTAAPAAGVGGRGLGGRVELGFSE